MTLFERLTQAADDVTAAFAANRLALDDARDIRRAVDARLSAEFAQDQARLAELTATAADPTRAGAVRRMAVSDAEDIKQHKFAPTEAERAAFDAALDEAEAALADARRLTDTFKALYESCIGEMKQRRHEVIGGQCDIELRMNWLESERRDFDQFIAAWEKRGVL